MIDWVVNKKPVIRQKQIALQAEQGKNLVYLRGARSKVYFTLPSLLAPCLLFTLSRFFIAPYPDDSLLYMLPAHSLALALANRCYFASTQTGAYMVLWSAAFLGSGFQLIQYARVSLAPAATCLFLA
ncbi:uncharacterized protein MKK02DRAFT_39287 [Dioszegia hungarica]|uniref:Uncharacterized protein n=1 Tax=Dioszegia hungarica TaxID=4972 RepID=A0AA38H3C4_9TREE|nr:uncharacterized protein MKK02DRAFT_39287 [Dioszegia hungarica]KAI9633308.1 hypothetical protein MKK02DRAFT_39287 [Dioszegia hungarica]